MLTRIALRMIVVIGTLSFASVALGQDRVHKYLNDTALKVKATESPALKREILEKNLGDMTRAVDTIKRAPTTTDQDHIQLDQLKATLQEKSDELAGVNGFDRVPDNQLNAFASYVVQDLEQADRKITIGLVTALLIVIIIILLV